MTLICVSELDDEYEPKCEKQNREVAQGMADYLAKRQFVVALSSVICVGVGKKVSQTQRSALTIPGGGIDIKVHFKHCDFLRRENRMREQK